LTVAEAAIEYGLRGYRVHPCRADKRPLTRWSQAATSDAKLIAAMWRRWPDALIGLRTGNGLVVVDDDRGLAEPDPSLATTLTAHTRSRGWHYFYTSAEPVACSVGVVAPGIDVRGENGYVIAPPSEGWSWINAAPVLELPEVIRVELQRHRTAASRPGGGFEPREFVPAGERHGYLLSFAGWLVANELAETYDDVVAETLDHAAMVCEPPDSDRSRRSHVEGIARWVLRAEGRS
jgi:hypothetical protein